MTNLSIITIGGVEYAVKDATARALAEQAYPRTGGVICGTVRGGYAHPLTFCAGCGGSITAKTMGVSLVMSGSDLTLTSDSVCVVGMCGISERAHGDFSLEACGGKLDVFASGMIDLKSTCGVYVCGKSLKEWIECNVTVAPSGGGTSGGTSGGDAQGDGVFPFPLPFYCPTEGTFTICNCEAKVELGYGNVLVKGRGVQVETVGNTDVNILPGRDVVVCGLCGKLDVDMRKTVIYSHDGVWVCGWELKCYIKEIMCGRNPQ